MTREWAIPLAAIFTAVSVAACGGEGNEATPPASTFTPAATSPLPDFSDTAVAAPVASAYPAGFPKEVPLSNVPERMRYELGEEDGKTTAVAVAPGVWAHRNPGTTVQEDADYGALIGWCSSVEAFEAEYGRDEPGTCW